MKTADSANGRVVSRRTMLATIPAMPALAIPVPTSAAPVADISARELGYLAINLRRADEMAQRLGVPLDTIRAWDWIVQHVNRCHGLDTMNPLDRADMIASIERMDHKEAHELGRAFARMDAGRCLTV